MTSAGFLEALQQTSQRLAADLADKTNQIDLLNSKLRTFNDDHAEEVQASRFQVMEQDKVIKGLQAEVEQLSARLHPTRTDSSCQTPVAATAHATCQAAPSSAETSQQTQPAPGCSTATQTEPAAETAQGVGIVQGTKEAVDGVEQEEGSDGRLATCQSHQETQTEGSCREEAGPGMASAFASTGSKWRHAAGTVLAAGELATLRSGNDAQRVDASDARPSNQSLAFDLQVLTKKYERAVNQKIEAEEASLQAQMDVAQLIKLCEFYKAKAETAVLAQASSTQHSKQEAPLPSWPQSQANLHAQPPAKQLPDSSARVELGVPQQQQQELLQRNESFVQGGVVGVPKYPHAHHDCLKECVQIQYQQQQQHQQEQQHLPHPHSHLSTKGAQSLQDHSPVIPGDTEQQHESHSQINAAMQPGGTGAVHGVQQYSSMLAPRGIQQAALQGQAAASSGSSLVGRTPGDGQLCQGLVVKVPQAHSSSTASRSAEEQYAKAGYMHNVTMVGEPACAEAPCKSCKHEDAAGGSDEHWDPLRHRMLDQDLNREHARTQPQRETLDLL